MITRERTSDLASRFLTIQSDFTRRNIKQLANNNLSNRGRVAYVQHATSILITLGEFSRSE
jgi:hypothetical protein